MQFTTGLLFLAAAALLSSEPALAVRTLNRSASARAPALRASRPTAEALVGNESIPVLVVEVPVVRLVVVDDEEETSGNATGNASSSRSRGLGGLSDRCGEELRASGRSETQKAAGCEKQMESSQQAARSLQKSNLHEAEAVVQKTFQTCGGMSETCAKEIAPDVVLKMRLSGVAVSERCAAVASNLSTAKTTEACQSNFTKEIMSDMGREDLEGALSAAEAGLHRCNKIEAPCDFQLAPLVVGQLAQLQAEQRMQEVFFTGLRAAEEMAAALARNATKAPSNTTRKVAPRRNATSKASPRTISLLSLARRVRIVSERRAVSLGAGRTE